MRGLCIGLAGIAACGGQATDCADARGSYAVTSQRDPGPPCESLERAGLDSTWELRERDARLGGMPDATDCRVGWEGCHAIVDCAYSGPVADGVRITVDLRADIDCVESGFTGQAHWTMRLERDGETTECAISFHVKGRRQ